jgi:hypothetical protein
MGNWVPVSKFWLLYADFKNVVCNIIVPKNLSFVKTFFLLHFVTKVSDNF